MTSKHEHDQLHTSSEHSSSNASAIKLQTTSIKIIMTVMKNRSGQQFSMMSKGLHQNPCNQDSTMIKIVSHQTRHVEIQLDQDRHIPETNIAWRKTSLS